MNFCGPGIFGIYIKELKADPGIAGTLPSNLPRSKRLTLIFAIIFIFDEVLLSEL